MWIIGLVAIVIIVYAVYKSNRDNRIKEEVNKKIAEIRESDINLNTEDEQRNANALDYSTSYQRKLLFTKNEYFQFKKLKEYADKSNLMVFPKVRILDILEPRKGEPNFRTLLYKVQAKHVDFLICDNDLRIKGVIELDDSSHDKNERKERDNFVDEILRSVGYKVVRTRYISEDTVKPFIETE